MPDNPNPSPPPAAKPVAKDPNAPKYSDEQKQKAEEKVVSNAAKKVEEQNKFIDEFSKRLVDFLSEEDHNTRTSVVDRIVQRVQSIRSVAANAKKFVSRGAVMREEKESMPRVITDERRNILQQEDHNKTDVNSGGDKK